LLSVELTEGHNVNKYVNLLLSEHKIVIIIIIFIIFIIITIIIIIVIVFIIKSIYISGKMLVNKNCAKTEFKRPWGVGGVLVFYPSNLS